MTESAASTSVSTFHEKLRESLGDAEPMCLSMAQIHIDRSSSEPGGQPVGGATEALDSVMASVQTRISNHLRSYDLMARIENDVFMMVVKTLADASILDARMYQIYEKLSEPYSVNGVDLYVPISLGAAIRMPSEEATSLITRTQKALQAAQDAGGKAPVLI